MIENYLEILPEVETALKENKPVVALESTIISHGMPYPQNVETARKNEEIIRSRGAVPATIAILNGKLKVGLSDDELEYFAQSEGVLKASRRDLPHIIAEKRNGATTVAATMIIADLAGIRVFVTGGIGGVHRGAEKSFDISADLPELANTDVAVVKVAGDLGQVDLATELHHDVLIELGKLVIGSRQPLIDIRDIQYQLCAGSVEFEWAAKQLVMHGHVVRLGLLETDAAGVQVLAEYGARKHD